MTFLEWLGDTKENVRNNGVQGFAESFYQFYLGGWRRLGRAYNYGIPIYKRDWDLLIVLDACRADLLAEVADDYEFLTAQSEYAIASTSAEWMEKNFLPKHYLSDVRETAYVSGNPFTDEVFFEHQCPICGTERSREPGSPCSTCESSKDPERSPTHQFASLEEVWQTGWDDDLGTIPPEPITERTIDQCRNGPGTRVIAHYMQPHHPFVGSDIETNLHPSGFGEMGRESVWDQLREGRVSSDQVWKAYVNNLRYVLDDVERLLRNVNADRVVITADHANAIGEFGLYGHYRNVPLPAMKRVPWCETTAKNTEEHAPENHTNLDQDSQGVEKRLEDLGYL